MPDGERLGLMERVIDLLGKALGTRVVAPTLGNKLLLGTMLCDGLKVGDRVGTVLPSPIQTDIWMLSTPMNSFVMAPFSSARISTCNELVVAK